MNMAWWLVIATNFNTVFVILEDVYSDTPRKQTNEAARGDAGSCGARASAARATTLGVRSHATGLPDCMAMNIAGGAKKLQQDADELGITADDLAQAGRLVQRLHDTDAAALAARGRRNPNLSNSGNPDAVRLGEQIGQHVMGQQEWEAYITTPVSSMGHMDQHLGRNASQELAMRRRSREGWVFCPGTLTVPWWTRADTVTFVLPDHTEENPLVVTETLQDAISEAYHVN